MYAIGCIPSDFFCRNCIARVCFLKLDICLLTSIPLVGWFLCNTVSKLLVQRVLNASTGTMRHLKSNRFLTSSNPLRSASIRDSSPNKTLSLKSFPRSRSSSKNVRGIFSMWYLQFFSCKANEPLENLPSLSFWNEHGIACPRPAVCPLRAMCGCCLELANPRLSMTLCLCLHGTRRSGALRMRAFYHRSRTSCPDSSDFWSTFRKFAGSLAHVGDRAWKPCCRAPGDSCGPCCHACSDDCDRDDCRGCNACISCRSFDNAYSYACGSDHRICSADSQGCKSCRCSASPFFGGVRVWRKTQFVSHSSLWASSQPHVSWRCCQSTGQWSWGFRCRGVVHSRGTLYGSPGETTCRTTQLWVCHWAQACPPPKGLWLIEASLQTCKDDWVVLSSLPFGRCDLHQAGGRYIAYPPRLLFAQRLLKKELNSSTNFLTELQSCLLGTGLVTSTGSGKCSWSICFQAVLCCPWSTFLNSVKESTQVSSHFSAPLLNSGIVLSTANSIE